jgi:hypothetical protein
VSGIEPSIRADAWTGEAEAGDFPRRARAAAGSASSVPGSVVQQEFGRPSEFGTTTVEATVLERLAIFTTTVECA